MIDIIITFHFRFIKAMHKIRQKGTIQLLYSPHKIPNKYASANNTIGIKPFLLIIILLLCIY